MRKCADIPKWDVSPQSNPVLQSPTTPCLFDMWKHADISKWDVSPQIEPSASEPYYTVSIWHEEVCRHTKMRCIPPNQTQCCRALQHHMSLTCTRMQMYPGQMYPPESKPSASAPYYTKWVWYVQQCKCTQIRCTPLSKPSTTHPYYTIWVWHVDTYIWTQVQCTPLPNQTQCYRILLYHVCFTCEWMHM